VQSDPDPAARLLPEETGGEMKVSRDRGDRPRLQAVNISKGGTILADDVVWAGTSSERKRGLLGRERMEPGEGMYIVPCKMVHTFRMKFPIDVAFISADGRVTAVHHSLKPNRVSKLSVLAEGALELPAGTLRATDTEVGDTVRLSEAGAKT